MRITIILAQKLFKIRLEVDDDRRTRVGTLDLYSHANLHSHFLASHGFDWEGVRSHHNENRCMSQLPGRVRSLFYLALAVGNRVLCDPVDHDPIEQILKLLLQCHEDGHIRLAFKRITVTNKNGLINNLI